MARQAFVVSFYALGEKRPSDCYGDFVATRSEAHDAGREYLAMARQDRVEGGPLAWIHRYTVRRVWLAECR